MQEGHENDPLHGLTLEAMLLELVERYGWEGLAERIPVRCFSSDPSVASSLKFLRRTPWARAKAEALYLGKLRRPRPRRPGAGRPVGGEHPAGGGHPAGGSRPAGSARPAGGERSGGNRFPGLFDGDEG